MKNILIIGDGIIGMLSAIVLSAIYQNVYLIRSSKKKYHQTKIDRFFSINLLTKYFFIKNGIWEDITMSNPQPYNKIVTWDDKIEKDLIFESSSISYDNLGYIIKETSIINSLLNKLASINNILSINDTDIKDIYDSDNTRMVMLSDGESIDLDLVLKSDKSMDSLLSSEKFKYKVVDYKQHALVIDLFLSQESIQNIAYQKFSESQIMGLLPISKNQYNLIWSVNNNILDNLKNYEDVKILSILNSHLSEKIGNIKSISNRTIFPLSGFHAESYVINKTLAIGAAAHAVHPMAGLGLNMGIQDIFLLENVFSKMHTDGHDISQVLENFNKCCVSENKKTYNTINFLKKFYSENFIPDFFRSQSLKIFNKNKYLKNKVIESATGIDVLKRRSVRKYCYPS
jgi:2-polyprenylphenol 6-hydroxylase|tara:strand:- start:714 stop:1913 length:1200 start_codon:yes stop_codon:yes gene_type:complete